MSIVGGLDIHRKQITFNYVDTETGEVRRGQICPAHPRAPGEVAGPVRRARTPISRWKAARDGGTWPRRSSRRGADARTLADPAEAAHLPRPEAAGQDRPGRCPAPAGAAGEQGRRSAGFRRRTSWSAGRCWRPTWTCGNSGPGGCSGSTRYCSATAPRTSPGEPSWGPPRARRGAAGPRPRTCSPAGQLQLAIAAQMLLVYDPSRLHPGPPPAAGPGRGTHQGRSRADRPAVRRRAGHRARP